MGGTKAYTINPAITRSHRPQPGTRSLSRVAPFQIPRVSLGRSSSYGAPQPQLPQPQPQVQTPSQPVQQAPQPQPQTAYVQPYPAPDNQASYYHQQPPQQTEPLSRPAPTQTQPTTGQPQGQQQPQVQLHRNFTLNSSHNCTMLSRRYPFKHNLNTTEHGSAAATPTSTSNASATTDPAPRDRKHIPMHRGKRSNNRP
jgi:hypothetical protein